ncbi:hypothetical protein ACFLZY_02860 [Patescibacteria group bacterium]
MIEIIPSLLVESKKEFEEKLRQVENDVETIHVDILDGSMFDHTTWFDAHSVAAMRTNVKYELHLMVENPLPIITEWKKHVEQTYRAIVHAEIDRQVGAVVDIIHETHGLEAGLALNPETPLSEIHHLLHQIEQLTIMGVHPGSSGQSFQGESILNKIKEARNHLPDLAIEIDGGVTDKLITPLIDSGCTRICTASLLFSTSNPQDRLKKLKQSASTKQ